MSIGKIRRLFSQVIERTIVVTRGCEAAARWAGVKVGAGGRIYSRFWGSEPFLIEIGDRVTITSGVKFLTHDGATWLVRDEGRGRYYRYGNIVIESDVFIGVNAVLMPGVRVGCRSVVAAGAVVTKSVPSGSVVGGVPARRIMSFEEYDLKVRRSCPSEIDLSGYHNYRGRVDVAVKYEHSVNCGGVQSPDRS